jgi:COP9 signalosome complex subunit 1
MQNALKCYVRARDYCTSSRHILSLCLSVIRTSVEMGNYLHVANYVSKAETTPDLANVGGGLSGSTRCLRHSYHHDTIMHL